MNLVIKERDAGEISAVSSTITAGPLGLGLGRGKGIATRNGGGSGGGISLSAPPKQQPDLRAVQPPQDNLGREGGSSVVEVNEEDFQDDYMKSNHHMMNAMSEEEMLKHIEELRLSISAKSMEVLQSDKFKRKVGLLPSAATTKSEKGTGSRDGSSVSALPPYQSADDFTVKMPNTLAELEELQRAAPTEWRRQIEWTLKQDRAEEGQRISPQQNQTLFGRSLNRSKYDRFALDGSKVVEKDKAAEDLRTVFSILGLSQTATSHIASKLIDELLLIGFCVLPNPPDTQPQDELLQHEQDPDEPGYSFMEISEMFRSEEKHQRSLAVSMLRGILTRRDDAVSTEPYAFVEDRSPPEPTTSGYSFSALGHAFQRVYAEIIECMLTENVWEAQVDGGLTQTQTCYIRRILTFATLFLCAADFPTALPTLLLWGFKLRLPIPAKLGLLRCLQSYLYSETEEHAACRLWGGLWGVFGCPTLQTPHDRRMEASYEEYLAHCLLSRDKETDSEDATLNPLDKPSPSERSQPQRSVQERFALRNRWGRVDAMIQDGDLTETLSSQLLESIVLVLDNKPEASIAVLYESSFLIVLSVLEMACAMARIGDRTSVIQILQFIIKRHWSSFSDKVSLLVLLSPNSEAKDEGVLVLDTSRILALWFRLLAETARRDGEAASWMASQPNLLNFLLSFVLRTADKQTNSVGNDALIWALRLWHVLLCYGLGVETVSELLIAAQVPPGGRAEHPGPRDSSSGAVLFSVGAGLRISSERSITEFLSFMEQAAVTCGSIVSSEMSTIEECDGEISPRLFSVIQLAQLLLSVASSVVRDLCAGAPSDPQTLHFVSSTLGLTVQPRAASLSELFAASQIRGRGLVPICKRCIEHFRLQRSMDARLEHLDGVAESFVALCSQLSGAPTPASRAPSMQSENAVQQWLGEELSLAKRRLRVCLASHQISTAKEGEEPEKESEVSVHQPKATEGLFAWQRHRLQQANALCRLQGILLAATTSTVNTQRLSADAMGALCSLGQGMVGPAVRLVSFLVNGLLDRAVAGHAEIARLRERIVIGLFCVSTEPDEVESLHFEVRLSSNALSAECTATEGHLALADWLQMQYNPKVPLSSDWFLRCLPFLTGGMFDTWVSMVAGMEERGQRTASSTITSSSTSTIVADDAARKLYQVLKLANPEVSGKWFCEDSPTEASATSVSAFISLVGVYFTDLLSRPTMAREALTKAAEGEAFTATSKLTAAARSARPAAAKSTESKGIRANLDAGLMELCDKLLQAALVPTVDHDVHCVTLLLLVCPLVASWKMQQKVWLELSSVRCVHLLHGPDEAVLFFVPYFVLLSRQNVIQAQTARAVVSALSQLRRPQDERLWPICSMGIQHVVNFLFEGAAPGALDAARMRFLQEVLARPAVCPQWLLYDILNVAAADDQLKDLLGRFKYPSTKREASDLGRKMVAFWDEVRGKELPETLTDKALAFLMTGHPECLEAVQSV